VRVGALPRLAQQWQRVPNQKQLHIPFLPL
jgi:hypothetical protein